MAEKLPTLHMLIGVSGAGKSTYAKKLLNENTTIASSDMLRKYLWGDENEQKRPAVIFEYMEYEVLKAFAQGKSIVYDATNLNAERRKQFLDRLRHKFHLNFKAVCYCFDVPVETCIARQDKRERKVPEEVIRRQAAQLQRPSFQEGWDSIKQVTFKQN